MTTPQAADVSLFRLPNVLATTGMTRSGLYARVASGLFTRPVKIGPKIIAWPAHEVQAIVQAHVSGMSESGIALLVQRLQKNRTVTA